MRPVLPQLAKEFQKLDCTLIKPARDICQEFLVCLTHWPDMPLGLRCDLVAALKKIIIIE